MALFPHYRATPGAVYQAADAVETTVKPIRSLRGAVLSRHAQAVAHTSGILQPPLSAADHQTVQTAESVCQAAAFAAGCTRAWGDAVATYDTGSTPSTAATRRRKRTTSVSTRQGSDNAETPFMRATHGPLTAELQYLAVSGNSYLHLVLSLA